jgi:hypothetical protein
VKVGDKVRRLSTATYNDIVGTVVEIQGTTVYVSWGGTRVSGPAQPYPVPQSDLVVVQAAPPPPPPTDEGGNAFDGNDDKGNGENGETEKPKSSLPLIAGIAIAALLLWRGSK